MCDACDDEFECDDACEQEIAPGAVWVTSGSAKFHWTDLVIALADVVSGLGEVVAELGDSVGNALRNHANYVAGRRAFGSGVLKDIETL